MDSRGRGGRRVDMRLLEPLFHFGGVEPGSGKANMPVRAQQVIRRRGDGHARELPQVVRMRRDLMNLEQIAASKLIPRWRGLADEQQMEPRVVESLEHIASSRRGPEAQMQPREAVAAARRAG